MNGMTRRYFAAALPVATGALAQDAAAPALTAKQVIDKTRSRPETRTRRCAVLRPR